MKQLHRKIANRKQSIEEKKRHIKQDYQALKNTLSSTKGLSIATVGGIVLGFLMLPKKFKLIKSVLKAYTMAATLKGFLDLIPDHDQKAKQSKPKVNKHLH